MGEFIAFSVILLLIMGAYYSFVILPRQRIFRQHNRYVRTLEIGTEVITAGGIVGRLVRMEAERGLAVVEIAEGVQVRILTSALSRPFDPEEIAVSASLGAEDTRS